MDGKNIDNIFGLVLAGGQSRRMGRDKSKLVYGQKPQFQVAYELLEGLCNQVFISSRLDQEQSLAFGNYPLIVDSPSYEGRGPISGILSAMKSFPKAA
ncbi:MAG: NTP transferase domain-containing protein, partial [Candidatus Omnitrophica bacterium]|nr:NTP transferase domain-containing protein [Candidatus Omnitrophota bacterium]